MPGTRITDEDRKKIWPKFICTSCNLLLSAPMQTSCGHLVCASCVDALLESSNPRCPDDGTELKKEQVFPDAFTKRELRALSLHCCNPGCGWFGTYAELEAHSQVCEHAQINCVHAQCTMKFQRSHLGEHLKNECEYRSVKCEYCHKDIAFASLKDHVTTSCEGAPVTCKFCKQKVSRRDLERHEQVVCEEVPVKCEFQAVGCNHNKTMNRQELNQHKKDALNDHVRLLLFACLRMPNQQVRPVVIQELCDDIAKARDDIANVRDDIAKARDDIAKAHDDIAKVRAEAVAKHRMQGQSIRRSEQRIEAIELSCDAKPNKSILPADSQQLIHSNNGTLLWKIDDCQRKRQDAINGVKTALYSPHFYSAQYGYKMCAKIYMNGDGFGKGSHLSLFFVVMRGDYDSLQTWPFQKKITMMLLDQGNGDHMVDAFHSDRESSSFQRPTSDMNRASGSPLFMPIDSLSNRQYIKDDVMFIKIVVD